jgi:hypothetical protein
MISRMCRCQLVAFGDVDMPLCLGDVLVGQPCDDGNFCSAEDKCVAITPINPFDNGARCRGTIPSGLPCDDNNECTDEDVCTEVPVRNEFESSFQCRGKLIPGIPCTPFAPVPGVGCQNPCFIANECVTNYTCQSFDYEGDTFSLCRGVPNPGIACDDSNICTTDDTCVLDGSRNGASCQGSPAPGTPCDDGNSCTENDACVFVEDGGPLCQSGTPLPEGAPCSDRPPSTGGECVIDDYFGIFCNGEEDILPASAPL